jgi:hypothetical protein
MPGEDEEREKRDNGNNDLPERIQSKVDTNVSGLYRVKDFDSALGEYNGIESGHGLFQAGVRRRA